MENERGRTPAGRDRLRHWRFALTGCSVLIVFALIVIGVMLFSFYRSPYYRGLILCRTRIKAVGAALQRYSTRNDVYPDHLSDLVPDYLDKTDLHCPADTSPPDTTSYAYVKPAADAPASTVVLECRNHKLRRGMAPAMVRYLKSGEVVLVGPDKAL